MRGSLKELLASSEEVTLVLQGGGMRGVYGIAALDQLHKSGYGPSRFREVIGTSAGALNGAYFLTEQSEEGVSVYTELLSGRRFIDFSRRDKILDIDYLVDDVLFSRVPIDEKRLLSSPVPLWLSLARSNGGLHWKRHDEAPLPELFRAASAMPIFYGREIKIAQDTYLDGGVVETLGIDHALRDGPRNLLLILTKPPEEDNGLSFFLRGLAHFFARRRGHSPFIIEQISKPDPSLSQARLLLESEEGRVWAIYPSEEIVSRLTRKKEKLEETAEIARSDVLRVLNS